MCIRDRSTSSTTSGVAKLETALNQDINDSGGIDGAAERTAVASDSTTTSGGAPTAYYLSKDTEGVLWISKGSENEETEKYEIVDDYGTAVDFDWSFTWAGKTREATAFAVEGVDSDGNDTPDYWRLAIKHTTTDQAAKATA